MKNILTLLVVISIIYPQVNIESIRKNNSNDGFWHKIGLDMGFISGKNSKVINLNGAYRFDFRTSNGYFGFLVCEYNKGSEKKTNDETNVFSHKGFSHLRIIKNVFVNTNIEIFIQKEFNNFIDLNDRTLYGSGLRFTRILGEQMVFYFGSGIMHEQESFSENETANHTFLKSSNYMNHTFFIGNHLSIANVLYLQFDINNVNNYRILWDGIMDFPLNNSFSFSMKINYRYDVSPINPTGDNFITISNGLNWTF